jgi:hypothetical protein
MALVCPLNGPVCFKINPFKGTVSRDFRPSLSHQSTPSRALIHGLNPFRIWLKFVFVELIYSKFAKI